MSENWLRSQVPNSSSTVQSPLVKQTSLSFVRLRGKKMRSSTTMLLYYILWKYYFIILKSVPSVVTLLIVVYGFTKWYFKNEKLMCSTVFCTFISLKVACMSLSVSGPQTFDNSYKRYVCSKVDIKWDIGGKLFIKLVLQCSVRARTAYNSRITGSMKKMKETIFVGNFTLNNFYKNYFCPKVDIKWDIGGKLSIKLLFWP